MSALLRKYEVNSIVQWKIIQYYCIQMYKHYCVLEKY